MDKIAHLFTQRTTWAGIATALTALGIHFTPQAYDLLATAGAAIAGLVLIGYKAWLAKAD